MIKLIIISDLEPVTHSFSTSSIIIGSENSETADLKLSQSNILEKHLQIIEQKIPTGIQYYLVNLANDPFATLNGLPFGKQPLKSKDIIQVGNTTLRCEIEAATSIRKEVIQEADEEDLNTNSIEALIQQAEELARGGHTSAEKEPLAEPLETPQEFKIEEPHAQETIIAAPPPPVMNPEPKEKNHKLSLKDYYLGEYDDDEEHNFVKKPSQTKNVMTEQVFTSWNLFLRIIGATLGIIIIVVGLGYIWIRDQTTSEEIQASRSLADVSMALTYAQMKGIKPQNQNWSDPDFIRNNLNAVLGPEYSSLADVDAHGQLGNCGYMVRIYTSSDFSQFVVIAQPSPTLLQWVIPKATIVIDSKAMEMRKLKDLKALNRLLVTANTLDGSNASEISHLITQGDLIPLSILTSKKENQGFLPPKALGLVRPEAENIVYNAPRYYSFSQNLMTKAVDLAERPASMHEVSMLQQELGNLKYFPNLVLYSTEGLQHAILAQKSIATVMPKNKFLVAYLQLNGRGKITGAHLLMDDSQTEIAMGETGSGAPNLEQMIETSTRTFDEHSSSASEEDAEELDESPEHTDPLYLQISALANQRTKTLKPIGEEIVSLINKEISAPSEDFPQKLADLNVRFKGEVDDQHEKVQQKLGAIIRENPQVPAGKFAEVVRASHLESDFKTYLTKLQTQTGLRKESQEEIEYHINQIQTCTSWQELEHQANQVASLLQFEQLPDLPLLISFQNSARSHVIQKLNQFLLSSDHALPDAGFSPEYREMLQNILKTAWIVDPDTYEFYVSEFELRAENTSESAP